MRRFHGLLALVLVIAGCGGSSARKALKAESASSTTDAVVTTTTAAAGATGPTGPTGPTGAPGAPGAPGPSGIAGYEIVRATKSFPPGAIDNGSPSIDVSASCPAGTSILSGGGSWTADQNPYGRSETELEQSYQVDASTWTVTFDNRHDIPTLIKQTVTFTVTIACAVVS